MATADPAPAPRRFLGDRLVIATHNPGKLSEIADLLAPFGIAVLSAGDLGLPEPEETETSFLGNARLKALAAAQASGFPALADDSGLVVPALGGDPGIYSARWAGPNKDFGTAMARVLDGLAAQRDRRGFFVCALALGYPDGSCDAFEGRIEGEIVDAPRGSLGFGYDPIFRPLGYDETFGEMDPQRKHAISHRALAFRQLLAACF